MSYITHASTLNSSAIFFGLYPPLSNARIILTPTGGVFVAKRRFEMKGPGDRDYRFSLIRLGPSCENSFSDPAVVTELNSKHIANFVFYLCNVLQRYRRRRSVKQRSERLADELRSQGQNA